MSLKNDTSGIKIFIDGKQIPFKKTHDGVEYELPVDGRFHTLTVIYSGQPAKT